VCVCVCVRACVVSTEDISQRFPVMAKGKVRFLAEKPVVEMTWDLLSLACVLVLL
jgi:hypothetical protein